MKKHQTIEEQLQTALTRIKNRTPELVEPIEQDSDITVRMLAKESEIHPATIYRYPEIKAEVDAMKSNSLATRYEAQRIELNKLKEQQQQYLDEIRSIKKQRDLTLEENYRLSLLVEVKEKEIQRVEQEKTQLIKTQKKLLEKKEAHIQGLLKQMNT